MSSTFPYNIIIIISHYKCINFAFYSVSTSYPDKLSNIYDDYYYFLKKKEKYQIPTSLHFIFNSPRTSHYKFKINTKISAKVILGKQPSCSSSYTRPCTKLNVFVYKSIKRKQKMQYIINLYAPN